MWTASSSICRTCLPLVRRLSCFTRDTLRGAPASSSEQLWRSFEARRQPSHALPHPGGCVGLLPTEASRQPIPVAAAPALLSAYNHQSVWREPRKVQCTQRLTERLNSGRLWEFYKPSSLLSCSQLCAPRRRGWHSHWNSSGC